MHALYWLKDSKDIYNATKHFYLKYMELQSNMVKENKYGMEVCFCVFLQMFRAKSTEI